MSPFAVLGLLLLLACEGGSKLDPVESLLLLSNPGLLDLEISSKLLLPTSQPLDEFKEE